MTTLTGPEIADQALEGWANLLGGLQTRIQTPDFATGLAFVKIGAEAERLNHHSDLDLELLPSRIRLSSHDVGGVTERDVELARLIPTSPRPPSWRPTRSVSRVSSWPSTGGSGAETRVVAHLGVSSDCS